MAVELQGRRRVRIAGPLIASLFVPALGAAQTAPAITAGYEYAHDRYEYFFENPSTFDTPNLVPHNFRQTYWADNHWLSIAARYRIGGRVNETIFAITPSREIRADDVDTFFLPSGDVATSGTSGRADIRSFRIRHDLNLGAKGGITWHAGYQYRRDRQEFHAQQIKTVTHSQPPSIVTFPIDGAETTISNVHEVRIGVGREWRAGQPWRIRARVDAAPTTYAELTTILPIKYPGREIVFSAPVMTLNPWLTIERGGRWPIAFVAAVTRTFSYTGSRRFDHRVLSASLVVSRE